MAGPGLYPSPANQARSGGSGGFPPGSESQNTPVTVSVVFRGGGGGGDRHRHGKGIGDGEMNQAALLSVPVDSPLSDVLTKIAGGCGVGPGAVVGLSMAWMGEGAEESSCQIQFMGCQIPSREFGAGR